MGQYQIRYIRDGYTFVYQTVTEQDSRELVNSWFKARFKNHVMLSAARVPRVLH